MLDNEEEKQKIADNGEGDKCQNSEKMLSIQMRLLMTARWKTSKMRQKEKRLLMKITKKENLV